jgi:hypothetical protein
MRFIVWLTMVAFAASAQTQRRTGAKDIFIDPSAGSVVYTPRKDAKIPNPTAEGAGPSSMGIRYRIELLTTEGEIRPVSAARAFHTDERIRLQLESNLAGRLIIWQQLNGGPPEQLFPSRKRAADMWIEAYTPVLIPARGFKFDDKPGLITLTVRVDPGRAGAESQEVAHAVPPIEETQRMAEEGSRSLVFEEDGHDVYLATTDQGQTRRGVIAVIKLRHVR